MDRLDITRLRAGEHLARRLIQIDKACKASPGKPTFSGLDFYTRHTDGSLGSLHTPASDKYVAEILRGEALVNRNRRLALEESTVVAPKAKAKGKKGAAAADGLDEE